MTLEALMALPFRLGVFWGGSPGSACELPRPQLYVADDDDDDVHDDHDHDDYDDDDDDDDVEADDDGDDDDGMMKMLTMMIFPVRANDGF